MRSNCWIAASSSADSKTAVWQFQQSATINQCLIVIGDLHCGQLDIKVSPSNQTLPIRIGWLGLTAIVSGLITSIASGCISPAVGYEISGCNSGEGKGVSSPSEKNAMLVGSDCAAGPVMGTRLKESELEIVMEFYYGLFSVGYCFNYRWSVAPKSYVLDFSVHPDLNYLSNFPRQAVVHG